MSDSVTPGTAACQVSLSFTISWSWWCHPTISSSVAPFSSCFQSFLTSRSFPMSQLFPSGGQNIGASPSTSVLPVNIKGWFPLGLTGLLSLLSEGLSRVFSNTTVWKHQFLGGQPFYGPTLTSVCDYWENHSFDYIYKHLLTKWCLCFLNILSRFVIAFIWGTSIFLISWIQSQSTMILEPKKIVCSHCFCIYLPWNDGTRHYNLSFLNVKFYINFFSLHFHLHEEAA